MLKSGIQKQRVGYFQDLVMQCCCGGSKADRAWPQWLCYECLRPQCFVFLLCQLT